MHVAQLSFWDNEALESGYHYMADLKLGEAILHFNEALQAALGDDKTICEALAACNYWQPRIKTIEAIAITDFLADYKQYPFTHLLQGLKKSLLRYLVDWMLKQTGLNGDQMETAFDLLLEAV